MASKGSLVATARKPDSLPVVYSPSQTCWPTYEFRPLPDWVKGVVHRYADGAWIVDDGQYDLAFVMPTDAMFYGIALPHHRNILWSWITRSWHDSEPLHPRQNAWHYMLREGATDWGDDWSRQSHPNTRALDDARDWLCRTRSCANGHHVEFNPANSIICAGLLRECDTKEPVAPPSSLKCMYGCVETT